MRQSAIFALNPAPKAQKPPYKSLAQIEAEAIERATRWQALLGTDGIESKANLAGYFGVSRTRITHVLSHLSA